jgi:universal stress protein A
MFKHLLVPLDFTQSNESALSVALQLAQQNDSRVILLHVIETIDHVPEAELKSFYETLEQSARENLVGAAERFESEQVPVAREIVFGRRGPEIVRCAVQQDVELVVMSSHRIDAANGTAGWATLSYQVAAVCPCPVLLVK